MLSVAGLAGPFGRQGLTIFLRDSQIINLEPFGTVQKIVEKCYNIAQIASLATLYKELCLSKDQSMTAAPLEHVCIQSPTVRGSIERVLFFVFLLLFF